MLYFNFWLYFLFCLFLPEKKVFFFTRRQVFVKLQKQSNNMKHLIILKKTIKILNFHERILNWLISCNIDTKKVTCKAKKIQTNLTANKKNNKSQREHHNQCFFHCWDTAAATLKGVDPAHHKNSFWMLWFKWCC